MTATEDKITLEVLTFLAQIREQIATFFRHLSRGRKERSNLHIMEVLFDVECRQYDMSFDFEGRRHESGLNLEVWIEATVDSQRTLTWWLDIIPLREAWLLDARIYWNITVPEQDTFQDIVVRFPEHIVGDFQAVKREVPYLLRELFVTGEQVLNSTLSPGSVIPDGKAGS